LFFKGDIAEASSHDLEKAKDLPPRKPLAVFIDSESPGALPSKAGRSRFSKPYRASSEYKV
jgi:hypothetical protein